jgi:von Willebrand factor type A domain-containing protein/extracellular solute-binding protein
MPRHMALDHHDRPVGGRRLGLPGRIALVAAALVTVVGGTILLVPRQTLAKLPGAPAISCDPAPVDIVVSPELLSPVTQILRPIDGKRLTDGYCLEPQVRSQEPQETVASADILPLDRAPQVWLPDATVWGEKVRHWPMTSIGSMASSPVVVATSAEAAEDLGWAKTDPTWMQVLRGTRPLIVPDYQSQSESLDSLIALWQSLGKGKKADQEVVATVLAADRSELPDPAAAIADARSGSSNAPLFPATEQAVAYLNATSTVPQLTAVYPREGSPILNYPIYRVGDSIQTPTQRSAVDAVITRLRSNQALETFRQSGFRRPYAGPGSSAVSVGNPVGTGIRRSQDVTVLEPPGRPEVDGMIARVEALAKPSRILTVMDVSGSMREKLDDGVSRIQLAAAAARLGVNLLPDSGSVGLWVFAGKMGGGKDYRVLGPVKQLGSRNSNGETQRNVLMRIATTMDSQITNGGTGLYDTTIAAMREMHAHYDPEAVNAIILLTDGGNSDKGGASLNQVLAEIKKLNQGNRKVAIYTAGLGAAADYRAMKQIADTSGGYTYRIDNALSGQQALLDGLRRSRKLGS